MVVRNCLEVVLLFCEFVKATYAHNEILSRPVCSYLPFRRLMLASLVSLRQIQTRARIAAALRIHGVVPQMLQMKKLG